MTSINLPGYTGTIGNLTVTGSLASAAFNTGTATKVGINAGVGSDVGSIAIGASAGNSLMAANSIAIGAAAGRLGAAINSIAIGTQAGELATFGNVAIGTEAARNGAGDRAIAIGHFAGRGDTSVAGSHSICIGTGAGRSSCPANAVVISTGNQDLSPATAGFFCNAIVGRAAGLGVGRVGYDTVTKELYYSTT